jgi:hypothetical protein
MVMKRREHSDEPPPNEANTDLPFSPITFSEEVTSSIYKCGCKEKKKTNRQQ